MSSRRILAMNFSCFDFRLITQATNNENGNINLIAIETISPNHDFCSYHRTKLKFHINPLKSVFLLKSQLFLFARKIFK